MSVSFYPPVQPGVLDACVAYTFCLLARASSIIGPTSDSVGGMQPAGGGSAFAGGWWNNGGLQLKAIDGAGAISNAPADMAVRCQAMHLVTPFSGANQAISVGFAAYDNAGNSANATQTIVVRSWTLYGTWSSGSAVNAGTALTFTTSGTTGGGALVMTFGLTAHGLGVGDRVYIGCMANPSATRIPAVGIGAGFYFVTAVPDANHITVTNLAFTDSVAAGAAGAALAFDNSGDGSGHAVSLAYILAAQSGRNQNDITSAASMTGTEGTAITPFPITTDGAATPNAQGVPNGIGLAAGILSGTPVQFGWFPVVLIVGTMQRLAMWSIAAGSYSSLIVAPATVNVALGNAAAVAVSAPSLNGTSVEWSLGNAPSGAAINSEYASVALVTATFTAVGSYPVLVIAISSNGVVLQTTITFVVSGISPGSYPVVTAATIPNVVAGTAINYQFYASGEPTSWSANGLSGGLTLAAVSGTLSGVIYTPGIYNFEVIATNGAGSSAPLQASVTVTAPAALVSNGSVAQYLSWLASDLSLIDLQVDLRYRGVASFYGVVDGAAASSVGLDGLVINLYQADSCKFAVLFFTPAQVNDATTIWLTAKTGEDNMAIIDEEVTGSAALTSVEGGEYYLIEVNLADDLIGQAFDDMNAPADGAPRVLVLIAQIAVLRASGQVARSQPFCLTITQRVARANAATDYP
jgi:hypothetical protein